MTPDPAWTAYRKKLNAAGYRASVTDTYEHKGTGRVIYPHNYGPQPDGTTRVNWRYWAELDHVPPPF